MKEKLKAFIYSCLINLLNRIDDFRISKQRSGLNIAESVILGRIDLIGKNIIIGEQTYINSGSTISSGENSKVEIGKYCAIGRYTHISSKTHSLVIPTRDELHEAHGITEKDIKIGNYVWIGDKVFIREGVTVGNFAIVAANSVVNRDVLPFEIVGGLPIRHIRFNTDHYKYSINQER